MKVKAKVKVKVKVVAYFQLNGYHSSVRSSNVNAVVLLIVTGGLTAEAW